MYFAKFIKTKLNYGYSLFELSIVLIIMSTLAVVAMNLTIQYADKSKIELTKERIEFIEQAILSYISDKNMYKTGLIPCPADGRLGATDNNLGFSAVSGLGVCQGNAQWSNVVVAGVVPVRTLEIPDEYMFDGWGRKLTYIVDQKFAVPDARCTTGTCFSLKGNNGGVNPEKDPEIIILDSNSSEITNDAVFVILSHGKNGYGAWTANSGQMVYFTGASAKEIENAHTSSNGISFTSYNNSFVQQTEDNSSANYYDDILSYKTHIQIISEIAPKIDTVNCSMLNAAQAITPTILCADSDVASQSTKETDCMDIFTEFIQELNRICFP